MPLLDLIERFDISFSDASLLYAFIPAIAFFFLYAVTSPWWRVKKLGFLGLVTVLHSFSTILLLFLVCYAIIFGQKVNEEWRTVIALTVAAALTSKLVVYLVERRNGMRERARARRAKTDDA